MPVNVMEKLTVIAPQADLDAVLLNLMKLRAVELIQTPPAPDDSPIPFEELAQDAQEKAARVKRIDTILPLLAKRTRRHGWPLAAIPIDPAEFLGSDEAERAWKTVEEAEKILVRTTQIKAELAAEEALMQSLLPYLGFAFSLDEEGTKTTKFLLGRLPVSTSAAAIDALSVKVGFVAEILTADKTGVYVAIITHRADEEGAKAALAEIGFIPAAPTRTDGRAAAVFDAAQARAEKLKHDLLRQATALDTLAENLTAVKILSDIEHNALLIEEHKKKIVAMGSTAVLTAWVPSFEKERLTEVLERLTVAYEFSPPDEQENPPVLAQDPPPAGNKLTRLLGIYRYPKCGKFDPTLPLGILYLLFFGFFFPDAGLGLVLALGCFGTARLLARDARLRCTLLLFGLCGVASIVFGVLFGSYFGDLGLSCVRSLFAGAAKLETLSLLPAQATAVFALLHPAKAPAGFFTLCLFVGGLWLLADLLINTVALCRAGKPLDALFDLGPYLLLLAGIGTAFYHWIPSVSLSFLALVAVFLSGARHQSGKHGKLIGGTKGLLSLAVYLSDGLSIMRAAILGLPLALIGWVVHAPLDSPAATVIGFFVMLGALALSHPLNLAMNALSTFTKKSLLRYMAFFGAYYEGHDVLFAPMKTVERYTKDAPPPTETPEESEVPEKDTSVPESA